MNQHFNTVGVVSALSLFGLGCGTSGSAPEAQGEAAAPPAAAVGAPQTSTPSNPGIVLRVREGGQNPDKFCVPTWSIANETAADVGDLLVQIEWRQRSGEVLQPIGEFGTMVRALAAGTSKDLTLNGYAAACRDIEVHVATYACRNADAVRTACPGPFRVEAPGAITAETSRLAEGPMRGAVEPQ